MEMILTKAERRRGDQALTLIELLLSLVLLLLLAGAVVFSYSTLQTNQNLDEGLSRLEAVFAFARARAASSGKTVYLAIESAESDPGELEYDKRIRIQWESDPFNQPGVFTNIIMQPSLSDAVNYLVKVEPHGEQESALDDAYQLLLAGDSPVLGGNLEEEAFEASDDPDTQQSLESGNVVARFAFFPDGSSESAKLIVTSRDGEDQRRFLVELIGLTGTVRRSLVDTNGLPAITDQDQQPDSPGDPFDDPLMTNSQPSTLLR